MALALALLLLACCLSACNLSRPEVTLTLASIDTRTPAATKARLLPSATPLATITPLPSPSASQTLTVTPTASFTLSPTKTVAASPSHTSQPTPTRITIDTATPTFTPVDSQPQALVTPSPSAEPTQPATAPATFTPLPTLNHIEVAQLLATPPPLPRPPATWTAAPTLKPTAIVTRAASQPHPGCLSADPWPAQLVNAAALDAASAAERAHSHALANPHFNPAHSSAAQRLAPARISAANHPADQLQHQWRVGL